MILTTTPSVEGKTILKYLGVVSGRGDNAKTSLDEMTKEATELSADAIVGIQIAAGRPSDYNCFVYTLGTAIKFLKPLTFGE